MKFTFRLTLLSILLLLLGSTICVLGATSYHYARSNADDLADQLLEQAAARTDQQIDQFLSQARDQSLLMRGHIEAGRVRADEPAAFVGATGDALGIARELTSIFIGWEANGDSVGVSRLSGHFTVWHSQREAGTDLYQVREFNLTDYPHKPFREDHLQRGDIRDRPWYKSARSAGKPVWTETFVFIGVAGIRNVHGVSYATPVFGRDGQLSGVLIADFELKQLCETFRRSLKVGKEGIPFVIERRADGSQRVIAHPSADLLVHVGENGAGELRTPDAFPDPRVAALASAVASRTPDSFATATRPVRFQANGENYIGFVRSLQGDSFPPWLVCVVLPESEILGRVHQGNQAAILIGFAVLAIGVLLSLYVAAQVARPLEAVARNAAEIGAFHLDPTPVPHSLIREVDHLAVSVENMKGGLRSFQKYVPADLVRSLIASGKDADRGGELRAVTIFFSDVVDFTGIAEDMGPEQLVSQLSEYFDTMSKEIKAVGGTVDKFIGDAVMAFWGAPALDPSHAANGCRAALACQTALARLNQRWQTEGKRPFATRIGLHTGEVVVGNVGSDTRLSYTIIGDAVNLASRLEGLNKVYGTRVLISEATYRQAEKEVVGRPIDFVAVKGKRQPVLLYELLGLRGGEGQLEELAAAQGKAITAYRAKDWTRAIALFGRVLDLRNGDAAAGLMIARCQQLYQANPPEAGWDGVFRLTHK